MKFNHSDLGHNEIKDLRIQNVEDEPFGTLVHLHDLILHHNNIERIEKNVFHGLKNLQVLYVIISSIQTTVLPLKSYFSEILWLTQSAIFMMRLLKTWML